MDAGGAPRPKPDLAGPQWTRGGAALALGPVVGLAVVSDSLISLYVVFAENKRAEGKENQDVALEKADDVHDVMVGPVARGDF